MVDSLLELDLETYAVHWLVANMPKRAGMLVPVSR